MSILAALKGKGPNGFGYRSTADDVTAGRYLNGQTILVTGCNSGLGLQTVRVLGLRGARVIATARTADKARAACATLAGDFVPLACELSDPTSVRACVEAVKKDQPALDVIICNAGIMALPEARQAYGYELQFLTNHIGHFMLVTGLLGRLTPRGGSWSSPATRTGGRRRAASSSTTCRARATTSRGRPTGSRSWPTSCSPRSWRAAWAAAPDRRRTRSTPG